MSREEILEQLEKDVRTIARNHEAEVSVENPDEDGHFMANIYKDNVPTLSDVKMLIEAYGLHHEDTLDVDHSWGYINILVTEAHYLKAPDIVRRTMCGATRVY